MLYSCSEQGELKPIQLFLSRARTKSYTVGSEQEGELKPTQLVQSRAGTKAYTIVSEQGGN